MSYVKTLLRIQDNFFHFKLNFQMTESLQKKEDESLKNAEEIDALKRFENMR